MDSLPSATHIHTQHNAIQYISIREQVHSKARRMPTEMRRERERERREERGERDLWRCLGPELIWCVREPVAPIQALSPGILEHVIIIAV